MEQKYDISPRQLVVEWIEALRSGEYAQGQFCLRDSDSKFCCLGVLSDVAMKHMRSVYQDSTWSFCDERDTFVADGCSWTPPYYLQEYTQITKYVEELENMNDIEKLSFQDIADHIETNILPEVE